MNKLAKWKSLPKSVQMLMRWNKWIHWDLGETGNTESYSAYMGFRHWFVKHVREKYDVETDISPDVDSSNYMEVWFLIENYFDKQSLLDIEDGKEYKILTLGGGKPGCLYYRAIEKMEK